MKPVIQCRVGDVVEVSTPNRQDGAPFEATVTLVQERFGHIGRRPKNPCLMISCDLSAKPMPMDASFVTRVIERAPVGPESVKNIYRETGRWIHRCYYAPDQVGKDTYRGTLRGLAEFVLANAPGTEVLHEINVTKLLHEFVKQTPGVINREDTFSIMVFGVWTVRMKPFRKWVLRNISRITVSRTENHAKANASRKQYDKEYWEELKADMERELAER